MREIQLGSLVSFVTVDRGIDIDVPSGTLTKHMSDHLVRSRTYYPQPGQTGLIVGGPELCESGQLKLWHVLVGGGKWWFADDEILPLVVQ